MGTTTGTNPTVVDPNKTLAPGGNVTLPTASNLMSGVQCGVNGTSVTGTVDLRIDTPAGKPLVVTLYKTQSGTAWNSNVTLSFGSNATANNYVAFAGTTLNLIGSAYPSDLQVANSSLTTVTLAGSLSGSSPGWVSPLNLSGCALTTASIKTVLAAAIVKMALYHAACSINVSGGTNAAMVYPTGLTVTAGTGGDTPDANEAGTYAYFSNHQPVVRSDGTCSPVFTKQ